MNTKRITFAVGGILVGGALVAQAVLINEEPPPGIHVFSVSATTSGSATASVSTEIVMVTTDGTEREIVMPIVYKIGQEESGEG
jgi:hypothetical protein